MKLAPSLEATLRVPAIAAPMFLVSGPDLVVETCAKGLVGSFPALNQRTSEGYEAWLHEIAERLATIEQKAGTAPAPYAVNLIVHKTNERLQADLDLTIKHKVPIVITSLGAVKDIVDAVHDYGGLVFHDVINARHAHKAAAAGVDGLIAVSAGAGGHAGTLHPFALVSEIRRFFDGTLILAGALSTGRHIAAAQLAGADLAYLGTRFIATKESMASDAYKAMLVRSTAKDVIYTPRISGINANFLRPSIEAAGLDPDHLEEKTSVDLGEELSEARAWKNIWSAGHGVSCIEDIPSVSDLCDRLHKEYLAALDEAAALRKRFG